MSSVPATVVGPLFWRVLSPHDYAHGLPGRHPQQIAIAKPLLGHSIGLGYIADVVEKQEESDPAPSPVSRRVVLLVEPTLQQVAETWSDPVTGAYRFDGLSMSARFTVVAYDHLRNWRAVIANGLAAKVVQP